MMHAACFVKTRAFNRLIVLSTEID